MDTFFKITYRVPTIYFATRTHKQIANVIKELRKTPYANEIRLVYMFDLLEAKFILANVLL